MTRLLDSSQAAQHLGVSLRALKDLRTRRRIPYYRVDHRSVRFAEEDLDKFLARVRIAAIGENT